MHELAGCLDVFTLGSGKNNPGGLILLVPIVIFGAIAMGISDEPPPTPITEKVKRAAEKRIPHPINNWKIKRAEKKYKREQEEAQAERELQSIENLPPHGTLPEEDEEHAQRIWNRWYIGLKERARKKLNKDYEQRQLEEKRGE